MRTSVKSRAVILGLIFCISLFVTGAVYAQIAGKMVPIITFLLDEAKQLVKSVPTGKLNDTGLTVAAIDLKETTEFNQICDSEIEFPQDCNYGADIAPNQNDDGVAGFSFTFIDDEGQLQEPQDKQTACAVVDNVTGLIWDTGRDQPGLNRSTATYHFTSPPYNVGVHPLLGTHTNCENYDATSPSTFCNTKAYVDRLNAARWCGYNDWRLPTSPELITLLYVNPENPVQNIDTDFFWLLIDPDPAQFYSGGSWSSTIWPISGGGSAAPAIYEELFVDALNFRSENGLFGAFSSDDVATVRVVRHD